MPKIVIQVGLDPDLFNEIETERKETPRATYINRKLKSLMREDND